MYNLVVLASGEGTNFQKILDESLSEGGMLWDLCRVRLLVMNRIERVGAVERAEKVDVPWKRVFWRKRCGMSRKEYDVELAEVVLAHEDVKLAGGVDLVVLAGWMHILTSEFLDRMKAAGVGVINLHPALAGTFAGAHAIADAWTAFQDRQIEHTGVMCHYVIPKVDAGELICQKEVPIFQFDNFMSLKARVQEVEKGVLLEGIHLALKRIRGGKHLIYQGKVRDVWELVDSEHLEIVATDRLSSFDRAVCEIPKRGELLTMIAERMFQLTCGMCRNHMVSCQENVMKVLKCRPLKVEVVVRGYLTGTTGTSILTHYNRGERRYCGWDLPDGLEAHRPLPEVIVTPTTKAGADEGGDQLVGMDQVVELGLVDSEDQWREICRVSIEMFTRVGEWMLTRGLILADTKLEFGVWNDNHLMLIDEAFTPDSSRYWRTSTYESRLAQGMAPESLDKDLIRSWLRENCEDPYDLNVKLPEIPDVLKKRVYNAYDEFYQSVRV